MALDYKVIKDNFGYNVVETGTEQIIKIFERQDDAKKLMKHLNLGGGFAGYTPNFFLKETYIKIKND